MKWRLIFRDIVHSRSQATVFVLCVALSLVCIVAINSFRNDVRQAIIGDARALHGGDILVHSHYPDSPGLAGALEEILTDEGVDGLRTWEFYSVVRRADGKESLLAGIKAVEAGYPLYGQVELLSGGSLATVLKPGQVVVAAAVLERLGLEQGDQLLLGQSSFTIADVISRESLRPVDFFNFGPRILLSAEDLPGTELVQGSSRVHYQTLLRLDDAQRIDELAALLQARAIPGQERVSTYATAGSNIKRFFDNLFFFLSLVAVFTMLLAGIGMQSSLAALLRGKERSMAIFRALGATSAFLLRHYLLLVLFLATAGAIVGIGGGLLLERLFLNLFATLLPDNVVVGASLADILEGLGLGLAVVAFFTLLPLASIREVKPTAVFNKSVVRRRNSRERIVLLACGTFLLGGLVIRQLADLQVGLSLMGGILVLVVSIALLTSLLLSLLARLPEPPLALRQAVRSLLRPGNATRSIVATLASAFSVLLAIYLLQDNLQRNYIQAYPPDAPNLFCLDIQKDQRQGFLQLVGEDVELFPVIRARLTAINDRKIDPQVRPERRGDSLTREFNLSYRDDLQGDEEVIAGGTLYQPGRPDPQAQVSVLDYVAKLGKIEVGDRLSFNIQGVPLTAEVSSIRSRTRSMLYPFFYFLFPEQFLQAAPQTFFAALAVEPEAVSALENRIVNAFPNISTINVSETAAELGEMVNRLAVIVAFLASFAILAGALILVSSVLATRLERIREVVHYKVLGAGSGFVIRVFFFENLLLALFSAGSAVLAGQAAAWGLCHFLLEVPYHPEPVATLGFALAMVGMVVALGLLSSLGIIRRRPALYLREL